MEKNLQIPTKNLSGCCEILSLREHVILISWKNETVRDTWDKFL